MLLDFMKDKHLDDAYVADGSKLPPSLTFLSTSLTSTPPPRTDHTNSYMPARVREDPNPEAAKEAFKLSLTHNLVRDLTGPN